MMRSKGRTFSERRTSLQQLLLDMPTQQVTRSRLKPLSPKDLPVVSLPNRNMLFVQYLFRKPSRLPWQSPEVQQMLTLQLPALMRTTLRRCLWYETATKLQSEGVYESRLSEICAQLATSSCSLFSDTQNDIHGRQYDLDHHC